MKWDSLGLISLFYNFAYIVNFIAPNNSWRFIYWQKMRPVPEGDKSHSSDISIVHIHILLVEPKVTVGHTQKWIYHDLLCSLSGYLFHLAWTRGWKIYIPGRFFDSWPACWIGKNIEFQPSCLPSSHYLAWSRNAVAWTTTTGMIISGRSGNNSSKSWKKPLNWVDGRCYGSKTTFRTWKFTRTSRRVVWSRFDSPKIYSALTGFWSPPRRLLFVTRGLTVAFYLRGVATKLQFQS